MKKVELCRCGGRWTQSRFHSFVKSLLRSGTRRWACIQDCKKNARVRKGFYLCAGCGKEVPATIKIEGKRVNNALVDHIKPIIDPEKGFTSWDDVIEAMFCEEDNLQLLCKSCHDKKTEEERIVAKERRKKEKNNEE